MIIKIYVFISLFIDQSSEKQIEELLKLESVIYEPKTELISTFACLSGFHDNHEEFKIEDKSVLVHMNPFYLDFVDLYPTVDCKIPSDFYGNEMFLNSYLLDFYIHETYKSIVNENGLRDEIAYKYLLDFKKILCSLEELKGYGRFSKIIRIIRDKYLEKFEKADFDSRNQYDQKSKKYKEIEI